MRLLRHRRPRRLVVDEGVSLRVAGNADSLEGTPELVEVADQRRRSLVRARRLLGIALATTKMMSPSLEAIDDLGEGHDRADEPGQRGVARRRTRARRVPPRARGMVPGPSQARPSRSGRRPADVLEHLFLGPGQRDDLDAKAATSVGMSLGALSSAVSGELVGDRLWMPCSDRLGRERGLCRTHRRSGRLSGVSCNLRPSRSIVSWTDRGEPEPGLAEHRPILLTTLASMVYLMMQDRAIEQGTRVAAHPGPGARPHEPGAPAPIRAAHRRRARRPARGRRVGRVAAGPGAAGTHGAAAARARADRPRRAAPAGPGGPRVARRGPRRAARAAGHPGPAAPGGALRPRLRRRHRAGARPALRRRVRARAGRARLPAEAARGPDPARRPARPHRRRALAAARARPARALAPAAGGRRGDAGGSTSRTRASTWPSAGRACPRSTRWKSSARSPAASRHRGPWRRPPPRRWGRGSRGPPHKIPRGPWTRRSTTWPCWTTRCGPRPARPRAAPATSSSSTLALARSLRARWARWRSEKWMPQDGLVRLTDGHARGPRRVEPPGPALFGLRPPEVRGLSLPVLPLRHLPAGAARGDRPARAPRPGHARQALPPGAGGDDARPPGAPDCCLSRRATEPRSPAVLDQTFGRVAESMREELAPAIARVWQTEIDSMRVDLRVWLERSVLIQPGLGADGLRAGLRPGGPRRSSIPAA